MNAPCRAQLPGLDGYNPNDSTGLCVLNAGHDKGPRKIWDEGTGCWVPNPARKHRARVVVEWEDE